MVRMILAAAVFTSAILFTAPLQAAEEQESNVALTEKQQSELSGMYDEVFETKKEIMEKYVEYGVYSQEKAEKMNKYMEKHHQQLEDNNFIPTWPHHHGKKAHHHE
ncbi:DUF2680 domain-containing protein [Alteribacillus sp. HJP-4]|uniref:DUF2680 domain-containing protein n=1 Tax=Alteribacillus sp. HJP-4 TaxID=2775394 RepID=UPI0035CD2C41